MIDADRTEARARERGRRAESRRQGKSRALTSDLLAKMRLERIEELSEEVESNSVRSRILLERATNLRQSLTRYASEQARWSHGYLTDAAQNTIAQREQIIRDLELLALDRTLDAANAYRDLLITEQDAELTPAQAREINALRTVALRSTFGRLKNWELRGVEARAKELRSQNPLGR